MDVGSSKVNKTLFLSSPRDAAILFVHRARLRIDERENDFDFFFFKFVQLRRCSLRKRKTESNQKSLFDFF